MNNIRKAVPGNRYFEISELGSKLDLSFSSHMSLGNKIIALDGIKKKLLVLDNSDPVNLNCIIDLNEVKAITVKKNYSSIKPGELQEKRFEEFLESICLRFEYKDEKKSFSLPFYEFGKNNAYDLAMLERNAGNWQMILSKMIAPNRREIPSRSKLLLP